MITNTSKIIGIGLSVIIIISMGSTTLSARVNPELHNKVTKPREFQQSPTVSPDREEKKSIDINQSVEYPTSDAAMDSPYRMLKSSILPDQTSIVPDFKFYDFFNGTEYNSTTFNGKILVMDFFATWCPPCGYTYHHFQTLNKAFNQTGQFQMMSIAADPTESNATVENYYNQYNMDWLLVRDYEGMLVQNLTYFNAIGGYALPTTVILNGTNFELMDYVVGLNATKFTEVLFNIVAPHIDFQDTEAPSILGVEEVDKPRVHWYENNFVINVHGVDNTYVTKMNGTAYLGDKNITLNFIPYGYEKYVNFWYFPVSSYQAEGEFHPFDLFVAQTNITFEFTVYDYYGNNATISIGELPVVTYDDTDPPYVQSTAIQETLTNDSHTLYAYVIGFDNYVEAPVVTEFDPFTGETTEYYLVYLDLDTYYPNFIFFQQFDIPVDKFVSCNSYDITLTDRAGNTVTQVMNQTLLPTGTCPDYIPPGEQNNTTSTTTETQFTASISRVTVTETQSASVAGTETVTVNPLPIDPNVLIVGLISMMVITYRQRKEQFFKR